MSTSQNKGDVSASNGTLLRHFSTLRGTAFGEATGDVHRCGVSDYIIAAHEPCMKCGPDSPKLMAPPYQVPVRYEVRNIETRIVVHIGRGEGVGEPLCCRKVDGLSGASSVGSKRRTVVNCL